MIKVNELFSGIGSQVAALKRLGVEHEVVGIAEIDKYAITSYEAIHGQARNYGDISKVKKLCYADLWTYSFPCQDISVAGKQAGISEYTRSGLLYEVERLLRVSEQNSELPKYLLLENVKNLVGKKFKAQFDEWLKTLDELGYNNYWQVLNAKNYGIPQNRERVFVVSVRKDIDTGYEFPKGLDNGLRLKDFLEDEVDEKFYISQEKTEKLIKSLGDKINAVAIPCITPDREEKCQNGRRFKEDGEPMFTLTSQDRHGILQVGMLDIKGNEQVRRVYSDEGLSLTLNTMAGGNRQPKIIEDFYINRNARAYDDCPTLRSERNGLKVIAEYRIRKLTPKECWRLMGFTDEDFQMAVDAGVSNSQLYKQAGNSIVVDVLCNIFKNLLFQEG